MPMLLKVILDEFYFGVTISIFFYNLIRNFLIAYSIPVSWNNIFFFKLVRIFYVIVLIIHRLTLLNRVLCFKFSNSITQVIYIGVKTIFPWIKLIVWFAWLLSNASRRSKIVVENFLSLMFVNVHFNTNNKIRFSLST